MIGSLVPQKTATAMLVLGDRGRSNPDNGIRLPEMTISGYDVVMKKARIAELKAHLSDYLRAVRRGDTVTVMDRDTPVARIVPVRQPGLQVRKPSSSAPCPNRVPLPAPLELKLDVVELLMEERQRQR